MPDWPKRYSRDLKLLNKKRGTIVVPLCSIRV
jgi:hypothetical protein